jgi:hypothetical protein
MATREQVKNYILNQMSASGGPKFKSTADVFNYVNPNTLKNSLNNPVFTDLRTIGPLFDEQGQFTEEFKDLPASPFNPLRTGQDDVLKNILNNINRIGVDVDPLQKLIIEEQLEKAKEGEQISSVPENILDKASGNFYDEGITSLPEFNVAAFNDSTTGGIPEVVRNIIIQKMIEGGGAALGLSTPQVMALGLLNQTPVADMAKFKIKKLFNIDQPSSSLQNTQQETPRISIEEQQAAGQLPEQQAIAQQQAQTQQQIINEINQANQQAQQTGGNIVRGPAGMSGPSSSNPTGFGSNIRIGRADGGIVSINDMIGRM